MFAQPTGSHLAPGGRDSGGASGSEGCPCDAGATGNDSCREGGSRSQHERRKDSAWGRGTPPPPPGDSAKGRCVHGFRGEMEWARSFLHMLLWKITGRKTPTCRTFYY